MSSGSKWGYVEGIVGSLSGYRGGTLGIVVEVKASVRKKVGRYQRGTAEAK